MSKVIIITASNNQNLKLANQFKEEVSKHAGQSEIIDLVDLNLPLYSPEAEKSGIPDQIAKVVDLCNNSNKFIFVTPEYNGGIAPSLNNFIAWVSRAGGKDWRVTFNNKTSLIATFSGGGGQHALMMLRSQLAFIGMNVIGRQVIATFQNADVSSDIKDCTKLLVES